MIETSGKAMNEYPGLGLPLRHWEQTDYDFYPIGSHPNAHGSESDIIPVRELAVMDVLEKLTDKPDWHKKIFDEEIVARWRKEALAIPDGHFWHLATAGMRQYWTDDEDRLELHNGRGSCPLENILDEATFDTCVQELRSKAKYFEESGIIPSLDACASVAKSDTLVTSELHTNLRKAFDKLQSDHAASPDWHPNSNNMVQDLEQVGVADAVERWSGKGEVIPQQGLEETTAQNRHYYGLGGSDIPPEYWFNQYQWLPANLAFQEDGSVKFTSYINNLHPTRYPDIYRTIEKLVETSIPMWDQCLRFAVGYYEYEGAGRMETRSGKPGNADDENEENWTPNKEECADVEASEEDLEEEGYYDDYDNDEDRQERLLEAKWRIVRKPRMMPIRADDVSYAPQPGKRLADKFRDSGLQIIVKMASIELTPEKPDFPLGGWHIEGQMNESICATALYYLDSENITDNSLSFRMQTSAYLQDDEPYNVGQCAYNWMEQNYGSVQTREGRLLAFPNIFQHRVSPFSLIDPTKPGHRRFIALWLVDPTKRIISTANVPPQQMDWYVDALLGSNTKSRQEALSKLPPDLINMLAEKGLANLSATSEGRLPEELMDYVREYFDEAKYSLPMGFQEASEHRKKLMQERGAFVRTAEEELQGATYSFCEH
ncbi:uncharacterized protein J4E84_004933 [Alternaria hordeiaustralica]|uniref:uncharacterized protein n=1 Tax=Alternaria hordeiaustralica TaxID=1187925 RepID=UPI0020C21E08|nr:uncharacterized protein J4E84_004933 [Alternaria hordeiaustralica]KAI4688005.1 hypothetical protein J4E84_004933 [Alternaria hordeiaustralica]